MEFGVAFPTRVGDERHVKMAEELGYDQCWFYDSQMLYSDVYATMALAADRTSSIRLGTGIAVAGTRLAPTIAHSIATINQLAPGRVELGFGRGYTGWVTMGLEPVSLKSLQVDFELIRDLLRGDTGTLRVRGKQRSVRHLHPDRGYVNLEDPITLSLSAFGPKTLRYTGAEADAHITWGAFGESFERARRTLAEGAREAGRDPAEVPSKGIYPVVVLRDGETVESQRVLDAAAPFLTNLLHGLVEQEDRETLTNLFGEAAPPGLEEAAEDYRQHVETYPDETRYLHLHEGHLVYPREDERRFVTPELVEQAAMIGTPDEIIELVRYLEEQGLSHFAFQVTDDPAEQIEYFATTVMRRY